MLVAMAKMSTCRLTILTTHSSSVRSTSRNFIFRGRSNLLNWIVFHSVSGITQLDFPHSSKYDHEAKCVNEYVRVCNRGNAEQQTCTVNEAEMIPKHNQNHQSRSITWDYIINNFACSRFFISIFPHHFLHSVENWLFRESITDDVCAFYHLRILLHQKAIPT